MKTILILALSIALAACNSPQCTGTTHKFGKWQRLIEDGKQVHNLEGLPVLERICETCGLVEITGAATR